MEEAALFSWIFQPLPAFGLGLGAILYVRGWRKLNRQVPYRFPTWRLWCYLLGLASLYAALASPLDAFASFLLTAHMTQHMLLTMVVPPLILLGSPMLPLLCGLPRHWASRGLGPFLHWPFLKGVFHAITNPLLAWFLFIFSNVLWHVPYFYEAALRSQAIHKLEHACFLATSLLFWYHIVQPWPSRPRWPRLAMIPYLVLADLQNTALGGFITFCEQVLYPTYANAPRFNGGTAMQDQSFAGVLMWVPGSIFFLVPAAMIAVQFLKPQRRAMAPPVAAPRPVDRPSRPFDILKIPVLGPFIRGPYFRRGMQILLFGLAVAVILDGILGPQMSPMNLAGVLPWTHWRALTVIALLAVGNLFCMACPFTFVRDLGRKVLPAHLQWPRALRSKWIAVALLVLYLWAYEAFDLWDKPAATAYVILGYFIAAMVIDGLFRGASFCKYVCPIGQFHFVQSLASPFEVKVREPDVCGSCRTFDCIKGNEKQRGCELKLFQPRKSGNMDCTFCLDCIKACPHDNVGIIAVAPGSDIVKDLPRSSVGRYGRRPDLAAVVLVLTFGAFANAAGMVVPVLNGISELVSRFGLSSDLAVVTLLSILCLIVLPLLLTGLAAALSRGATGISWKENLCRFSIALAPLGFGMWLAHFAFHFFTGVYTPIPVIERVAKEMGLMAGEVTWVVGSWAFYNLPALELLLLDLGFLLTLYLTWQMARRMVSRRALGVFLPWGVLALLLYLAGVWIIFQPMQMRGMMMNG